jgi:hypothetical protein
VEGDFSAGVSCRKPEAIGVGNPRVDFTEQVDLVFLDPDGEEMLDVASLDAPRCLYWSFPL